MNCYAGLAKRLIKSCFPSVIPVPQLEPLDARLIIKQEVKDINTSKACFALSDAHERVFKPISFKPISDEEAWAATLAWAEAKAQERDAVAFNEASQTNTDESYDSDDSEVGVFIQPVRSKPSLFGDDFGDDSDEDEDEDEYEDDNEDDDDIEEFARTIWEQIAAGIAIWGAEKRAATIIQAAARGRAVRAWNPFVSVPMALHTDTNKLAFVARFVAREVVVMVARLFGRKISAATLNAEAAKLEADARARRVVGPVMALVKRVAATIIQARARGRAVRVWKAQFTDGLAVKLEDAWRKEKARYLMDWKTKSPSQIAVEREQSDSIAFNTLLFAPVRNTILGASGPIPLRSAVWAASPKCVRAWIKLADWRRVVMFRV